MYKRNKYTYELRVQCVELVLKRERSVLEIARQKGVELSYLRLWVRFYEKYGNAGLMPRVKRQYTPAFKQRVLDTIVKERLSLRAACVRFNILSTSALLR